MNEWIVRLVQGMYSNARSLVHVGEGYSEEFEVKVGMHPGSVLSPLFFIIVLEALSHEFRCGFEWEDLYADNLVIMAEALKECVRRLDLERSNGGERAESKCRKDKDHDLCYRADSEFRQVPTCCLSHWSGQQQHLLQRL